MFFDQSPLHQSINLLPKFYLSGFLFEGLVLLLEFFDCLCSFLHLLQSVDVLFFQRYIYHLSASQSYVLRLSERLQFPSL